MSEHTFTPEKPLITVPLVPPPGATAVIIRATVTKAPQHNPEDTLRLFHVRLAGKPGAPVRETQILELIYRDGGFTAGFSGFGSGKKAMENPQNRHKLKPVHIGPVNGASFPVVLAVPFNGRDATVSPGAKTAMSDTEIPPGGAPMELLLGFEGPGDLRSPIGWTIAWEDNAVEWVGATAGPVTPPATPPPTPPPAPGTPPPPAPANTGASWRAELRKDLTALATKYAEAAGVDPLILLTIQLLAQRVG